MLYGDQRRKKIKNIKKTLKDLKHYKERCK